MKTKLLFTALMTLFSVTSFSQTTIDLDQVSPEQEFTVPTVMNSFSLPIITIQ